MGLPRQDSKDENESIQIESKDENENDKSSKRNSTKLEETLLVAEDQKKQQRQNRLQHKEIKAAIATKALKEEKAIDETVIKIAKDEEEAAATKALEEKKAKEEAEAKKAKDEEEAAAAAATKALEEK